MITLLYDEEDLLTPEKYLRCYDNVSNKEIDKDTLATIYVEVYTLQFSFKIPWDSSISLHWKLYGSVYPSDYILNRLPVSIPLIQFLPK